MRQVRQLILVALVAAGLATISPTPTPVEAAGTPPACPWSPNTYQKYCNRYTSTGTLGSIGLIGDSVLLGSADGASNPGLPKMLSDRGWGPINLIATLGMKTRWTTDNNVSAVYWLNRWHTNNFHPDVIAINLGANHLGTFSQPTCTTSNTTNCKTWINYVLDEIALHHPNARIWWAKVNWEPFGAGNGYGAGMLGWNKALDELAATNSKLVLWDWPTALLTANPTILMDSSRVHPSSATQYVKRSTLMATHITDFMAWSRYTGPPVALPGGIGGPYRRQRLETPVSAAEYTATTTEPTVVDVGDHVPDGAAAVDVMLYAHSAGEGGWLTLFPCGEPEPVVSSLNYGAGATRVSHAIVRLNADEQFCVISSKPAEVGVGLMAWYGDGASTGLTPLAPVRPLDSRNTPAKESDFVVDVPDGDTAAVTVTVTGTSSGGMVWAVPCDDVGESIPVVAYEPNEVVAGETFAPEQAGNVCIDVQPNDEAQLPDVIVDVNGVFSDDGTLGFVPSTATRLLDTRSALGGWVNPHGSRQSLDIPAAPPGAQAVTGTVTIVRPTHRSWLTAYPCGATLPPSSSVNAAAGLVLANSTTMGVRAADGKLCIFSSGRTNTLFDVAGWWVTLPS